MKDIDDILAKVAADFSDLSSFFSGKLPVAILRKAIKKEFVVPHQGTSSAKKNTEFAEKFDNKCNRYDVAFLAPTNVSGTHFDCPQGSPYLPLIVYYGITDSDEQWDAGEARHVYAKPAMVEIPARNNGEDKVDPGKKITVYFHAIVFY